MIVNLSSTDSVFTCVTISRKEFEMVFWQAVVLNQSSRSKIYFEFSTLQHFILACTNASVERSKNEPIIRSSTLFLPFIPSISLLNCLSDISRRHPEISVITKILSQNLANQHINPNLFSLKSSFHTDKINDVSINLKCSTEIK